MPIPLAAAVLAASGISAGANIFGASKAAKAQQKAAQQAIAFQREMFGEAKNALSPYLNLGQQASSDLMEQLPFLASPIGLDQEFLESTPGYQFSREQGMRAIEAALAKAGLGRSGAAVKEAGRFGTGLADLTYGQQFERERANRTDIFNRLFSSAESGRGAAGALAGVAVPTGANVGQSMIGAGNAGAAAYLTGARAVGDAGQNALSYYMLDRYLRPPQAGAGAGMYANPWTTTVVPAGA